MPRVPLQIERIDEGRFIGQMDADLDKAVRELLEFCRRHPEHAEGAKVALNAEIAICCESTDAYSVKTQVKLKLPGRPANVTMAIHEATPGGEEFLTVKPSGSDKHNPRQNKLCTDDGKPIDPETGEIIENAET